MDLLFLCCVSFLSSFLPSSLHSTDLLRFVDFFFRLPFPSPLLCRFPSTDGDKMPNHLLINAQNAIQIVFWPEPEQSSAGGRDGRTCGGRGGRLAGLAGTGPVTPVSHQKFAAPRSGAWRQQQGLGKAGTDSGRKQMGRGKRGRIRGENKQGGDRSGEKQTGRGNGDGVREKTNGAGKRGRIRKKGMWVDSMLIEKHRRVIPH